MSLVTIVVVFTKHLNNLRSSMSGEQRQHLVNNNNKLTHHRWGGGRVKEWGDQVQEVEGGRVRGERVDLWGEMRSTRRYDDIPGLWQSKSEFVRCSGYFVVYKREMMMKCVRLTVNVWNLVGLGTMSEPLPLQHSIFSSLSPTPESGSDNSLQSIRHAEWFFSL